MINLLGRKANMYNEKVIEYFVHPRNAGVLIDADGIGEAGSPACGDEMKVYLKIENDVIVDVKFQTYGCASAIASSSMATEMIKGKTIQEALSVTNKDVINALGGLPAPKIHCSVLAEQTIKRAILDYAKKHNITIEGIDSKILEDDAHDHGHDEE